jgi:hypothetical protein
MRRILTPDKRAGSWMLAALLPVEMSNPTRIDPRQEIRKTVCCTSMCLGVNICQGMLMLPASAEVKSLAQSNARATARAVSEMLPLSRDVDRLFGSIAVYMKESP